MGEMKDEDILGIQQEELEREVMTVFIHPMLNIMNLLRTVVFRLIKNK